MQPEETYNGLADSAEARAKADWLVGINASRALTLSYKRKLNVGRVQTPTLALVVERERQIKNHVAVPFYTVVANMGAWSLTSEHMASLEQAQEILNRVLATPFVIDQVERKTVTTQPPKLYNLTGL